MKSLILTYREFAVFRILAETDHNHFDCKLGKTNVSVTTNIDFCEKYGY